MKRILSFIATLAIMVTVADANGSCCLIAHQPEMPEGAKKLRKF